MVRPQSGAPVVNVRSLQRESNIDSTGIIEAIRREDRLVRGPCAEDVRARRGQVDRELAEVGEVGELIDVVGGGDAEDVRGPLPVAVGKVVVAGILREESLSSPSFPAAKTKSVSRQPGKAIDVVHRLRSTPGPPKLPLTTVAPFRARVGERFDDVRRPRDSASRRRPERHQLDDPSSRP